MNTDNKNRTIEFKKKANQIPVEIFESNIKPCTNLPSKEMKDGDSFVVDFGNLYTGNISFLCETKGFHQDAPIFLKIKFCENKRELNEDSENYKGWISKSWIQEEWIHIDKAPATINLERRYSFRYVKFQLVSASSRFSVIISDASAIERTSADDLSLPDYFGTDDEKKIYKVAARTLRQCMQNVFEDGPKRDRRLWIGDLRLEAISNYSSYRNMNLVKKCLYIFAAAVNSEGRIPACVFTDGEIEGDENYMFDYSLFFIPTLYEYVKQTKDLETGKGLFDTALRQWELSGDFFDEKDVMNDSDKVGWCFVDWNLNLNKQAAAQFIFIYCVDYLKRLAELLGLDKKLVNEIALDLDKKRKAAFENFYDKNLGLFISGKDNQIALATQSWGVLANVLSKDDNAKLLEKAESHSKIEKLVTPYAYHVFIEALCESGLKDKAYEKLMWYWGAMVKDEADTFYELFNPENPDESPYGSSIVNSYCHAWSCSPLYFLTNGGLNKKSLSESESETAPESFIFDLDGVLLSTDEFHYKAWKKIAEKLNTPFTEDDNNLLRGVSRAESLEIILRKYTGPELSPEQKKQFLDEKNKIYVESLGVLSPDFIENEVRQTLLELKKRGHKIAIGSSSKNTKFILAKTGLIDLFDAISDGTNITKTKPHPEVFLKAASYINELPQNCIVIEDAEAGLLAAKSAGMKAWGIGSAKDSKLADKSLNDFKDLLG